MLTLVHRESETDRCPGALRPWQADDGLIVRVRVPGGRISGAQLAEISALAQDFGNPDVLLTSRGSAQIRGLSEDAIETIQQRLDEAGLLPSSSHERVRNIVAAPDVELDALVHALEAKLTATPELQELSGRFVFAFANADGVGLDVPFDLAFQVGDEGRGVLVLDSCLALSVATADAVDVMIELATEFVRVREDASVWNVKDLPGTSPFFDRALTFGDKVAMPQVAPWPSPPQVVGAPLGLLAPVAVKALAQACDDLVILPNRALALRSREAGAVGLEAFDTKPFYVAGLIVDGKSAYNQISACVGAPACKRTQASTIALAHDVAFASQDSPTLPRIHISGCERQCGKPQGRHVAIINPRTFADIEAEVHIGA